MAFDSNKISNILGSKIPQWLINQLDTRSIQGAKDVRDNDNTKKTTQNVVNQVYPQVFMDKIDFIHNASVIDLLFCIGPTSNIYLKDSDL